VLSPPTPPRPRAPPQGSYTTRLFEGGIRRIAQKVGEEGVETALAAVAQDDDALLGEAADLLYHLTVLLRARGLSLEDARQVLAARRG
jgi:phosphoribosyl-ATP pyrophosphohydrolase/phosphoribosyl-AMP cyclohydrolase